MSVVCPSTSLGFNKPFHIFCDAFTFLSAFIPPVTIAVPPWQSPLSALNSSADDSPTQTRLPTDNIDSSSQKELFSQKPQPSFPPFPSIYFYYYYGLRVFMVAVYGADEVVAAAAALGCGESSRCSPQRHHQGQQQQYRDAMMRQLPLSLPFSFAGGSRVFSFFFSQYWTFSVVSKIYFETMTTTVMMVMIPSFNASRLVSLSSFLLGFIILSTTTAQQTLSFSFLLLLNFILTTLLLLSFFFHRKQETSRRGLPPSLHQQLPLMKNRCDTADPSRDVMPMLIRAPENTHATESMQQNVGGARVPFTASSLLLPCTSCSVFLLAAHFFLGGAFALSFSLLCAPLLMRRLWRRKDTLHDCPMPPEERRMPVTVCTSKLHVFTRRQFAAAASPSSGTLLSCCCALLLYIIVCSASAGSFRACGGGGDSLSFVSFPTSFSSSFSSPQLLRELLVLDGTLFIRGALAESASSSPQFHWPAPQRLRRAMASSSFSSSLPDTLSSSTAGVYRKPLCNFSHALDYTIGGGSTMAVSNPTFIIVNATDVGPSATHLRTVYWVARGGSLRDCTVAEGTRLVISLSAMMAYNYANGTVLGVKDGGSPRHQLPNDALTGKGTNYTMVEISNVDFIQSSVLVLTEVSDGVTPHSLFPGPPRPPPTTAPPTTAPPTTAAPTTTYPTDPLDPTTFTLFTTQIPVTTVAPTTTLPPSVVEQQLDDVYLPLLPDNIAEELTLNLSIVGCFFDGRSDVNGTDISSPSVTLHPNPNLWKGTQLLLTGDGYPFTSYFTVRNNSMVIHGTNHSYRRTMGYKERSLQNHDTIEGLTDHNVRFGCYAMHIGPDLEYNHTEGFTFMPPWYSPDDLFPSRYSNGREGDGSGGEVAFPPVPPLTLALTHNTIEIVISGIEYGAEAPSNEVSDTMVAVSTVGAVGLVSVSFTALSGGLSNNSALLIIANNSIAVETRSNVSASVAEGIRHGVDYQSKLSGIANPFGWPFRTDSTAILIDSVIVGENGILLVAGNGIYMATVNSYGGTVGGVASLYAPIMSRGSRILINRNTVVIRNAVTAPSVCAGVHVRGLEHYGTNTAFSVSSNAISVESGRRSELHGSADSGDQQAIEMLTQFPSLQRKYAADATVVVAGEGSGDAGSFAVAASLPVVIVQWPMFTFGIYFEATTSPNSSFLLNFNRVVRVSAVVGTIALETRLLRDAAWTSNYGYFMTAAIRLPQSLIFSELVTVTVVGNIAHSISCDVASGPAGLWYVGYPSFISTTSSRISYWGAKAPMVAFFVSGHTSLVFLENSLVVVGNIAEEIALRTHDWLFGGGGGDDSHASAAELLQNLPALTLYSVPSLRQAIVDPPAATGTSSGSGVIFYPRYVVVFAILLGDIALDDALSYDVDAFANVQQLRNGDAFALFDRNIANISAVMVGRATRQQQQRPLANRLYPSPPRVPASVGFAGFLRFSLTVRSIHSVVAFGCPFVNKSDVSLFALDNLIRFNRNLEGWDTKDSVVDALDIISNGGAGGRFAPTSILGFVTALSTRHAVCGNHITAIVNNANGTQSTGDLLRSSSSSSSSSSTATMASLLAAHQSRNSRDQHLRIAVGIAVPIVETYNSAVSETGAMGQGAAVTFIGNQMRVLMMNTNITLPSSASSAPIPSVSFATFAPAALPPIPKSLTPSQIYNLSQRVNASRGAYDGSDSGDSGADTVPLHELLPLIVAAQLSPPIPAYVSAVHARTSGLRVRLGGAFIVHGNVVEVTRVAVVPLVAAAADDGSSNNQDQGGQSSSLVGSQGGRSSSARQWSDFALISVGWSSLIAATATPPSAVASVPLEAAFDKRPMDDALSPNLLETATSGALPMALSVLRIFNRYRYYDPEGYLYDGIAVGFGGVVVLEQNTIVLVPEVALLVSAGGGGSGGSVSGASYLLMPPAIATSSASSYSLFPLVVMATVVDSCDVGLGIVGMGVDMSSKVIVPPTTNGYINLHGNSFVAPLLDVVPIEHTAAAASSSDAVVPVVEYSLQRQPQHAAAGADSSKGIIVGDTYSPAVLSSAFLSSTASYTAPRFNFTSASNRIQPLLPPSTVVLFYSAWNSTLVSAFSQMDKYILISDCSNAVGTPSVASPTASSSFFAPRERIFHASEVLFTPLSTAHYAVARTPSSAAPILSSASTATITLDSDGDTTLLYYASATAARSGISADKNYVGFVDTNVTIFGCPLPMRPPISLPIVKGTQVIVGSVGVVSPVSGQVTSMNAILRMSTCVSSDAGSGAGESELDVANTANLDGTLNDDAEVMGMSSHPLGFAIGSGPMGIYRGAVVGNIFIMPLIVAVLCRFVVGYALRLWATVDRSLETALRTVGWPSIVFLPYVSLGEGTAKSICILFQSSVSADVGVAVLGSMCLFGVVCVWVALLVRALPARLIALQPSEREDEDKDYEGKSSSASPDEKTHLAMAASSGAIAASSSATASHAVPLLQLGAADTTSSNAPPSLLTTPTTLAARGGNSNSNSDFALFTPRNSFGGGDAAAAAKRTRRKGVPPPSPFSFAAIAKGMCRLTWWVMPLLEWAPIVGTIRGGSQRASGGAGRRYVTGTGATTRRSHGTPCTAAAAAGSYRPPASSADRRDNAPTVMVRENSGGVEGHDYSNAHSPQQHASVAVSAPPRRAVVEGDDAEGDDDDGYYYDDDDLDLGLDGDEGGVEMMTQPGFGSDEEYDDDIDDYMSLGADGMPQGLPTAAAPSSGGGGGIAMAIIGSHAHHLTSFSNSNANSFSTASSSLDLIGPFAKTRIEGHIQAFAHIMGDRRLLAAELISFLCTFVVGIAVGLPNDWCRERILIAFFAVFGQMLCDVVNLIPIVWLTQMVLNVAVMGLSTLAVYQVFTNHNGAVSASANSGDSTSSDDGSEGFFASLFSGSQGTQEALETLGNLGNAMGMTAIVVSLVVTMVRARRMYVRAVRQKAEDARVRANYQYHTYVAESGHPNGMGGAGAAGAAARPPIKQQPVLIYQDYRAEDIDSSQLLPPLQGRVVSSSTNRSSSNPLAADDYEDIVVSEPSEANISPSISVGTIARGGSATRAPSLTSGATTASSSATFAGSNGRSASHDTSTADFFSVSNATGAAVGAGSAMVAPPSPSSGSAAVRTAKSPSAVVRLGSNSNAKKLAAAGPVSNESFTRVVLQRVESMIPLRGREGDGAAGREGAAPVTATYRREGEYGVEDADDGRVRPTYSTASYASSSPRVGRSSSNGGGRGGGGGRSSSPLRGSRLAASYASSMDDLAALEAASTAAAAVPGVRLLNPATATATGGRRGSADHLRAPSRASPHSVSSGSGGSGSGGVSRVASLGGRSSRASQRSV